MFTTARMEYDYVTAALWGRMMRNEIENDFDSLALAISKQVNVQLERCKEMMLKGDAIVLAKILKTGYKEKQEA